MRKIKAYALLLLTPLLLFVTSCEEDEEQASTVPPVDDSFVVESTSWTDEQAAEIAAVDDNVIPMLQGDGKVITPGFHNWDYWPLLNLDGSIAKINGYYILFMLAAPQTVLSGKRHDIAHIRYAISSDNATWEDMGPLYPEKDRLGSRNWAGSCYFDEANNRLWVFYTATGIKGENTETAEGDGGGGSGATAGDGISYDQRIAMTHADLIDNNLVTFENWSPHQEILMADGAIYAPATGTDETGTVYAFRDPWLYQNPDNEKFYLLFTARSAGPPDTFDGAIGIAEATTDDFTEWNLLQPLMTTQINSELERPHIMVDNGLTYLFFSTHREKFAEPFSDYAPEGLYGFVGPDLQGPYEPLNGHGLVAANPEADPYMTFSWQVLPDASVISNVNYYNVPEGLDIGEFGAQGEAWDDEHFGGTLAPRLLLNISGAETSIEGTAEPALPE